MPDPTPTRIRIRMYQVGFGDCFLVSFEYPAPLNDGRSERHMLMDFGSTRRSPRWGGNLEDVARLIEEHSAGRLDVLAVSHRHKDHLSGFAVDGAAKIIDRLEPGLVVRSWTEDPNADSGATGPNMLGELSARFTRSLFGGQELARALWASVPEQSRGVLGDIREFALDQIANQEAVERLNVWANGAGEYLHYGSTSRIGALIPGISVRVIGPPTLEQWPDIARQRENDPEFWMVYQRMVDEKGFAELVDRAREPQQDEAGPAVVGPERWLIERMSRLQLASLLRIVRILDDVLNNTSLILLIEAGTKRMLFPGDAQVENWNYALKAAPDHEEVLQLLGEVDMYKVGHHGSRNATPRTLFGLWTAQGTRDRPMTACMSTLSGVHGESDNTAVPRATLVAALSERMNLLSTEGLFDGEPYAELEGDLLAQGPLRLVPRRVD